MDNSATYMANKQAADAGLKVYHQVLEEDSLRPMGLQESFLMRLLKDNKETEYGRRYGFCEIHSIEEYQKRIPVVTYDDLEPYVRRMLEGEKNILTAYPVHHMNETSGTIGLPKRIPMSEKQYSIFQKYNYAYLNGVKAAYLNPVWMEGRTFSTSSGTCKTLPSGITVGSASAKMAEMLGGSDRLEQLMQISYTSPIEAMIPDTETDTKYLHLLFALRDRNITGFIPSFYSAATFMLQYLADHYEMFIHDVETGMINPSVSISDAARASISKKLKPMPERAKELRIIFQNGSDFPFLNSVWPKLQYIAGVGTDGHSVYAERLHSRFGQFHDLFSGVNASEGLWSLPKGMDDPDNILAAESAFLEFLPVEAGNDFSKAVTMDALEVGKTYELIITNLSGFYRYRMSDAVTVTGMLNRTPLVQFAYRVNRTINLAGENTTEAAITEALRKTAERLTFTLVDYCVYPDQMSDISRYVILIEPSEDGLHGINLQTLEEVVYQELGKVNHYITEAVTIGRFGRPEVHLLQPQTCMLYHDMMVMKGASLTQVKPVRVITNEKQRKFFFKLLEE